MKTIQLFFLLLFSISLSAQQNSQITGAWSFQNVHEQEKLDSTSVKMLDMLFGNMTLAFNSEGNYRATIMGEVDNGSWNLQGSGKDLILKSNNGETHNFEVIDLSENQMTLKLSKGAMVFKKTGEAPELLRNSDLSDNKYVKITSEEISRKWYLKRKESPGKSQAQIDMLSSMIAGAYFDFREDRTFEVHIMNMTEKGDWKLGDDQSSVITMKDGSSKEWNIHSISENELVLYPGNSEEKWIFATTE